MGHFTCPVCGSILVTKLGQGSRKLSGIRIEVEVKTPGSLSNKPRQTIWQMACDLGAR